MIKRDLCPTYICSYFYFSLVFLLISKSIFQHFTRLDTQQGLEIHGLEECGSWRCMVFNWVPKHLRYPIILSKSTCYYSENKNFRFLKSQFGHFCSDRFKNVCNRIDPSADFHHCVPLCISANNSILLQTFLNRK